LGDQIDPNDAASIAEPPPAPEVRPATSESAGVVQAALRQYERSPAPTAGPTKSIAKNETPPAPTQPLAGTVVLDVEQGGIVVPSFSGKSVRAAVELAQANSLDLDIVGSGLGMDQSPTAGSHVAAGSRVVVKFGR